LAVTALVQLLRQLNGAICEYDEQIQQLAQSHPDFAIFASLPGAGPALVPRLMVALGTQRDRYQSAHQIQCYSGIAPVEESSGQQLWVHWRWCCPKFLRQSFHEWALHSIGFSDWARAYYDQQRSHGKSITRQFVRWPSSGFVSYSAAGKTVRLTMKPNTRAPSNNGVGNRPRPNRSLWNLR
jgi:hypothetical protein